MTPVRLEPAAPRSQVKHSTTEPLHSLLYPWIYWDRWVYWVWGIVKTQYGRKYMCKIHDNRCSFWRIGASFRHTIYNECVCFCLIWFFTSQSTIFQLGLDGSFWCLAARTQCSDAGEARTPNPWVSSQALFYWATLLPNMSAVCWSAVTSVKGYCSEVIVMEISSHNHKYCYHTVCKLK